MKKLPDNFSELPAEERRRFQVLQAVEAYESGDTNAWLELFVYAVTADPDIPEPIKNKMRSRLRKAQAGKESVDLISQERRAAEDDDMQIYALVMTRGDTFTSALRFVAQMRGVSVSTIRRAYERHIKRYPKCERRDGRTKKPKPKYIVLRPRS